MRVLIADTLGGWRGGQRQAALLALGLAARGHEVRVAAPEGSRLAEACADRGVPVIPCAARSDLDLRAVWALSRAARWFRPDVVDAQEARAHGIARVAQALCALPGRLVVTRRVIRQPRGRWKYRRGVSAYVAVSEAVRRSLESAGVAPSSVSVVPPGVPEPPADEATEDLHARLGLDAGVPIVIAVGALTREKNPALLVRAAAHLRQRGPHAEWIVLGDGPLRSELERLARRLEAPIWFAGQVEDPGPWVRAARVFAHAASEEALPMALLEAMARGVPPVATRVGGVPEVVTGDAGVLVPPREPAPFADAVARLLGDEQLRARAAGRARERARLFSVDRMVEGTLAAYARVLGRGPAAARSSPTVAVEETP